MKRHSGAFITEVVNTVPMDAKTINQIAMNDEFNMIIKSLVKVVIYIVIAVFLFSMFGCVSTQGNGQRPQTSQAVNKGLLGAGIGTLAALLTGGHGEDYAKYIAIGGVGGYLWGNEQDKSSANARYQQPRRQTNNYSALDRRDSYQQRDLRYSNERAAGNYYENNTSYSNNQGYGNGQPQTKWRKNIKRITKNGKTTETITETGVSTKTEDMYYE